MAVAHDYGVGIGVPDGKRGRIAGGHPVVEQQRIVYEDGAPADFARPAEKLDVH
jgi:hypothetical protein